MLHVKLSANRRYLGCTLRCQIPHFAFGGGCDLCLFSRSHRTQHFACYCRRLPPGIPLDQSHGNNYEQRCCYRDI